MRHGALWIGVLGFALLAGCGDGAATKCAGDGDCVRGQVCGADKTCEERVCTSLGDCSGTNQVCVSGAVLGKDETKKYCTARECGGELQCTAPRVCEGGLCVETVPPGDAPDAADEDVPAPTDDGADEGRVDNGPPPPLENACAPCTTDGDCDTGSKCTPVGASKHCLPGCATNAECPKGFLCYAATSTYKACLPVSYDCKACIHETPCGDGQCCDFVNGTCKDCKVECAKCSFDFECGDGLRCLKTAAAATGVCTAECGAAKPCADGAKFTCAAADGGLELCTPVGDSCKGCPEGQFPSDDGLACWECKGNSNCKDAAKPLCRLSDHTCQPAGGCQEPLHDCGSDPATPICKECCEDSHCPVIEGAQKCKPDGTCVGSVGPCGDACEPPFSACVSIGGQPQCVQCDPANDACGDLGAACKCNDQSYSCLDQGTGEICGGDACTAICTTDNDCPPSAEGAALACNTAAAQPFCYDPTGACDGMNSCCGGGQSCIDLVGLLFGGLMGGGGTIPGMGSLPSGGAGYCSCDDAHPCLGGQNCQDLSGIIDLIGPLLGIDTSSLDIPKMCGNPLGGLGI